MTATVRQFSTDELEGMQETQESAMMDTCIIKRYSGTQNASGHPAKTWTDGPLTECGVDMTGGKEVRSLNRTVENVDAMIRLPIDTVIDQRDRIRVVMRFGVQQNTEITYDIAGAPMEGPSGLVVPCNVTDPGVNR